MRRSFCAVLLSCILALGTTGGLMAGDLTTAQAQQLVSAAQGAPQSEVTLAIDGKNVVFTVVRDAVGNVTARPVPGPDSAGITISQVSIQMKADSKGLLTPTSLVVLSNQGITSYSMSLNPDGTIASLYQSGVGGAGGAAGPSQPKPVVGGIGGSAGKAGGSSGPDDLPEDRFPAFTSGQLSLPAGAGTSEVSQSQP